MRVAIAGVALGIVLALSCAASGVEFDHLLHRATQSSD